MLDFVLSVVANYGAPALAWALTALAALLVGKVFSKIKNDFARGVIERATTEVFDVVKAVFQSYVDGIKRGNADGKLTDEEKDQARKLAWEQFASNLGPKGLERLGRVLGLNLEGVAKWFASKTETAIAVEKEKAISGPLAMRSPTPLTRSAA